MDGSLTAIYAETDMDYAVRLISLEDDPYLPIFTFRMWFLGILFTIIISGLNQFFSLRCAFCPARSLMIY